ncbi:uncharacterized protein LOC127700513 isoform X4 [Mytilus californianus]|uniref:uncharacterized protein LOC127700513 isoform X4 n=1 Tax=Mytilus californianus TaxID=6549 RepID=UPI002246BA49|nr:uncharacterized protein LOC127700513 isoform X4 [Mytilus californianus]
MGEKKNQDLSSKLPRNNMPLKDIFQKKIENSSSFLSDVWKPRYNEGNGGHQHQITEDYEVAHHHNIKKDGKHHSRTTKNCLQVQEVFENNCDDKEERQIPCICGIENCPFEIIDRRKREDPPEKRIINDFEMMKSYKAADGTFPFSFVSYMLFGGDRDNKCPFPLSSDDDSYEERSEDFMSSATMKFLNKTFPGLFEGKSKSLDEEKKENTKKQSTGFEFSPKPSRPPPKPPRKNESRQQFSISIGEEDKTKNDKSMNTCEKSVIDRVGHLNNGKSTDDEKSVDVSDTGSKNRVIRQHVRDENKLSISMDFSSHSLSENSKQKKPDFSQSFPTSRNNKSSLDKDSNPGFSQSFTSDLRGEDESSKKSAEDLKTSGSGQRNLASEKTSSQGLKTDLCESIGSVDDTPPYKSQQSNTFISHEKDDSDNPLDDIFVPECGPDLEEFPDLFNHDEPEESCASCVNESVASLPTACTDPETLLEEHMHYCPAAAHHHNVCCKCNQFTKNQHMLYELAKTEGLEMHDVVPDGNCMFRAIIDQLRMQGELTLTCHHIRQRAVDYLKNNPLQDDGTHLEDFFVAEDESWEEYLKRISRDGEWGDQIILRGLAEVVNREISIITTIGDLHNQTSITPKVADKDKVKTIYLGHVNDQHYYSLRPKGWHNQWYRDARRKQLSDSSQSHSNALEEQSISLEESSSEEELTLPCRPSKLINCSSQYIDTYSRVPIFHMNFIIENVLPKINIYTPYRFYGGKTCIVPISCQKKWEIAGSCEEGLSVNVYTSSLQNERGMGNESLNAVKVSNLPNLFKQIGKPNLVFKDDSYKSKSKVAIIDSENTSPGFTHVRSPKHNPQIFYKEVNGTYFLSNTSFHSGMNANGTLKIKRTIRFKDPFLIFQKEACMIYYYAKCPKWPKEASEWVLRKRPSGWPDTSLLEETLKAPCLLTPKYHPFSKNPDIEWMFDFSFPETFLLKGNISKEQKYCFHVFKLLIDFHTGRRIELSTFVLKTIFLYTLEVIPCQQWETCPSACMLYMTETLLSSLKEKKIPHYFIPENNIISHLNGTILYHLIEKVNVVREFPIMSVILMAEGHGLMTTYITDQIIEDLNHLSDLSNIHDSVLNTFIPAYAQITVTSLAHQKFRQAVTAVTTGYRMLQDLPRCSDDVYNPYENMSLEMFIKETTDGMKMFQVWWLCFFVDLFKKKNTLASFTRTNPFKKISDLMDDCPPGDLDAVSVPKWILQSYRYEYDYKQLRDFGFVLILCTYLMQEGEYGLAGHYLRGLVKMISKIFNDPDAIMAEVLQNPMVAQSKEKNIDYLMQAFITGMSSSLFLILQNLFTCYVKQGQTEYFQEYIEQFESVCNNMATPSSFTVLADIWRSLGNTKKMKEALEQFETIKT